MESLTKSVFTTFGRPNIKRTVGYKKLLAQFLISLLKSTKLQIELAKG